ncbi:MAG: hypothetical protein EOO12_02600 [Chitinophagaceae bacterium]|nr:MAG: hypothetical protein EOO12_02600 [Chitinophagaceae bacterium]
MRRERAVLANTIPFNLKTLQQIEDRGFKYVQVKGFTTDRHYDYVEPQFLVLFPMKELPTDQDQKDIYEPVKSDLLKQWAREEQYGMPVVIAKVA